MKVLMLNGSHNQNGNTFSALSEIGKQLKLEDIDYEIFQIGPDPIRDCIDCGNCTENGCVFSDDGVNEFIKKAKECDGFIFGSPVYYAHPSGRILSFLDRVAVSSGNIFRYKPGAAITVARRGGSSASFDSLSKYFNILEMPTPGSSYWNIVYGSNPGEANMDIEGMQTMRNLAKNMAWLLKCIDSGKKNGIELPNSERSNRMSFIR